MALTPGALIAGRYRVDRRIGAGGMSEVWIGDHATVGVKVALKTLLPAIAEDHEIIARFKREASLLGRIRSDYIVRVIDFITEGTEDLVLVMEYVEGDPLDRVLQQRKLTIEEAIEIGIDVATALCDLHRSRIVHRDLKPGNIILRPRGDGRARAVIVDFGISRLVAEDGEEQTMTGITKINTAIGTVEYMAPEQLLNSRDVTGVSDLYALGAMLFRAVAGHHVFGDLREHRLAQAKLIKDAPRFEPGRDDPVALGFVAVLARLLARRPSERYQHAEDVLADLTPLRELASGQRPAAEPAGAPTAFGAEPTVKPRETSSPSGRLAVGREPSNRSGPHPTPDPRPPMHSQPDARAAMASQHDARAAMASQHDARPPLESAGAGQPSPATPNAFAAPVVPAAAAAPAPATPRKRSVVAMVVPAVFFALFGGVGIGVVMWKAIGPAAPAAMAAPDAPAAAPSASVAPPLVTATATAPEAASAVATASAAAPSASAPGPAASATPAAASASATPAAASAAPAAGSASASAPASGARAAPRPRPRASEPVEVAPTAKGPAPDVGNVGF